jgi:hypothetical protein
MRLLTGAYWKTEGKGKKAVKVVDVPAEDKKIIKGNTYLKELFHQFYEDMDATETYGVTLSKAQAEHVFPYEYWDKTSRIENADINGKRYVEYCESLGLKPRFSEFKDDPGYWKLLIDRSMYNNDGSYHHPAGIDVTKLQVDGELKRDVVPRKVGQKKYGDPAMIEEAVARWNDRAKVKVDNAMASIVLL